MSLYRATESEMRDDCRRAIEALELWLRRLIHDKLSDVFGADYLEAKRTDGTRVIRSELARRLLGRQSQEPKRFSRTIDAALLEDEINIVCNPELYKRCFRESLGSVFPEGNDSARTVLQRLVPVRNSLYHANPLSLHDAYRVLCYSTDVIEGLKEYYTKMGMSQSYNVPTVVRIWDSLGHEDHLTGEDQNHDGPRCVDYSRDKASYLRCGDTLRIEVNVDPTFDAQEYEITWAISDIGGVELPPGNTFHLHLTERYVATRFCVVCYVASKKNWHKLGRCDDQVDIAYRVLPPL